MACRFLRLITTVIAAVRLEGWDRVRRGIAAVGVVGRGFADWAGVAAGGTADGLGSGSGGLSRCLAGGIICLAQDSSPASPRVSIANGVSRQAWLAAPGE